MTSEADRAATFRQTLKNRARAKRTAEKQLRGDAAARKQLEENTAALLIVDSDGIERGDVRRR